MQQFDLMVDGTARSLLLGGTACQVDDQRMAADIRQLGPATFSVLVGHDQHIVVLHQTGPAQYEARVAGTVHSITVRDPRRLARQPAGTLSSAAQPIRAPMPGRVLAVQVQVGDVVCHDQELLVLEAMKMQNALRSPGPGCVTAVHVEAGDSVSSGDTLVVVE